MLQFSPELLGEDLDAGSIPGPILEDIGTDFGFNYQSLLSWKNDSTYSDGLLYLPAKVVAL